MRWLKRKKVSQPTLEEENTASLKTKSLIYTGSHLTADEFAKKAVAFKQKLTEATNFEEIQSAWRSHNFPYVMQSKDPFSEQYRAEVKTVYQKLVDSHYDVQNELTSTHLSDEDFARGYPWTSNSLSVVASEIGKAVQGFRVLSEHAPDAKSLIEFGVGWGNTAIPLARAGFDVCAVDIDKAFLDRVSNEAKSLSANMRTLHADFLEAARNPGQRYDVVLFSSSFHHCFEFEELLMRLKENVLTREGCIAFFAEPISEHFTFPWGLRYDGEAVWAITCNKWLELGFSESFFRALMARTGFSVQQITDPTGVMGPAWIARHL